MYRFCEECNAEVDCPKCDGFGWIEKQRSADPQDTEKADCDLCGNTGKVKAHIAGAQHGTDRDVSA
jgi:DnaJ-class molecular chaperone